MFKPEKKCLCGEMAGWKITGKSRHGMGVKQWACLRCGLIHSEFPLTDYEKGDYDSRNRNEDTNSCENLDLQLVENNIFIRELIERKVNKDSEICDFGCGPGKVLRYLRAKDFKNIVGVEKDLKLVERLQKEGFAVFSSLDQVNKMFDVIVLFHVFEHIEDPILFLKKLLGKVKKNGEIYIYVPNALNPYTSRKNWYDWFDETHFWSYTPFNLKNIISCFSGVSYEIKEKGGVIVSIITKNDNVDVSPGEILKAHSFYNFLKVYKTFIFFKFAHYFRTTFLNNMFVFIKDALRKIIGR